MISKKEDEKIKNSFTSEKMKFKIFLFSFAPEILSMKDSFVQSMRSCFGLDGEECKKMIQKVLRTVTNSSRKVWRRIWNFLQGMFGRRES